jgi:hypothetical protein
MIELSFFGGIAQIIKRQFFLKNVELAEDFFNYPEFREIEQTITFYYCFLSWAHPLFAFGDNFLVKLNKPSLFIIDFF